MQMTPNNWDKAKRLFEAALELEPAQRASFLAANCHEVNLQQQVEKLLIDFQAAGSFLDEPAWHSTAKSTETEDLMINRRLGAYKLVRRVGQGGMAAVFLAVRADDAYQKEVAVKLVQPGLNSQDVLTRFRNERQTLAGLDHPNIVRLLDGGSTQEGLPFLVMEYVEGSPIDEYCDQHKLSVDERLRLFSDVCDGVQYAHEKLVIHRDLKPSNILVVADGAPKLLDFGIAKVLNAEPSAQSSLATQTSLRCMTPAYASPEQMRGKSVTPETDVYALGVVLYELLTGHRPYRLTQHSPAEIERAICEQEPETPSTAISRVENDTSPDGKPITKTPELVSLTREGQPDKLRRRLRGDLDNIVLKALQKEPQQRYRSVAEFSQDIGRHLQHQPVKARPSTFVYRVSKFVQRHKTEVSACFAILAVIAAAASFSFNAPGLRNRLTAAASPAKIQSLAVIPLVNISGDPNQDYFSDGMTDALITNLAQIGSLKVISRTSSMRYKQTKKSLPEIARELSVDGIIEGTVQRSGDRVRISAQLIQGPSDKHLWANSYERDVRDVFVLEREIAGDITRQVRAQVTTEKQGHLAQQRPVSPRALEAFLQGNSHMHRFSRGFGDEELIQAGEYFRQAIDAEPDFAPAYIGISKAHRTMQSSSEDVGIARKAAERAVELDPNLSDAWAALADIKCDFWDWAGAEQDFRRALALNPNDATAHEHLGYLLDALGRLDEGWGEAQIAQQLDPNEEHLEPALDNRREYDQIIQHITTMLQADPDNGGLHHMLYEGYVGKRMYKEAIEQLTQAVALYGFREGAAKVRETFAASGYKDAMRVYAEELEQLHLTNQVFMPVNLAGAYAAAGDKDRAFYWLEQGYKHRGHAMTGVGMIFINTDPGLDPLRSDPRYKDLLRRVGLPEVPINDSGAGNARNTLRDRLSGGSSCARKLFAS